MVEITQKKSAGDKRHYSLFNKSANSSNQFVSLLTHVVPQLLTLHMFHMLKCLSECVRRRCLMLSGRKESENSEWEFIFFSSRSLSFLNSLLTSIIAQLNEWRKNNLKWAWNWRWEQFFILECFFSVDDLWLPYFIFDNFNTYFICANNKFLLFCSAFFNSWNCFSVSQNREEDHCRSLLVIQRYLLEARHTIVKNEKKCWGQVRCHHFDLK